jgi:hypothetical protein
VEVGLPRPSMSAGKPRLLRSREKSEETKGPALAD